MIFIISDLPMNKLSELFNVNHFIVCQGKKSIIDLYGRFQIDVDIINIFLFCSKSTRGAIFTRKPNPISS